MLPYVPPVTMPSDTDDVPQPSDSAARPSSLRKKCLAVVALVTALLGLAVFAAVLVATGGGKKAPATETAEGPRASALGEDDCFAGFRQEGTKMFARPVPCTSPHEGEVRARVDLPILDYPGDERLAAEGEKACRVQASSLYAADRDDEFTLLVDRPDRKTWESGVHAVTCLLRYTGGPKSFRLEGQSTPLNLLEAGNCVETWHDTGVVDVVECTKKHEVQVFAKLAVDGDKDPDEAEVFALCAERARRIFGGKPPAHLRLRLGGPNEREWAGGQHYALCLVASEKGPLTRSVIPG